MGQISEVKVPDIGNYTNVPVIEVLVKVGDSGNGIPADTLPHIFDPFFTTKVRGTGMGLPVVQRIARLYDGSICVEKSSPEGTVFRLEFPACSHE